VNSTDQKTTNKLFAPGYGQNIININSLNSFFNYQSNNGEFVKIKFNNDNDKKFWADTIIVYLLFIKLSIIQSNNINIKIFHFWKIIIEL